MLCSAGGEMDLQQFERAVRLRLRHYTGRILADRMVAPRERQAGEGGGGGGGTAAEDASAQLAVLKAVSTAQHRLEVAVAEIRQAGPLYRYVDVHTLHIILPCRVLVYVCMRV